MADVPGGDENRLKRYQTVGPGAARIRWGTEGDWTRCHVEMLKHVDDASARRMCSQWHHDMTGEWPGSKANTG